MKKPVTGKDIFHQLKADLIGKDSYRGVTLSYSWLANQFGHFSLGFIPSYLLFLKLTQCKVSNCYINLAPVFISVLWLLFETFNFLGPLLSNSHSKSKLLFVKGPQYTFKPAWWNVLYDTMTDLGFFWFGSFTAAYCYEEVFKYPVPLLMIVLLLLYPARDWYLTKIYLQNADYPFQFRLSQWDLQMNDDNKNKVLQFLENGKENGCHLLVFGTENSGKTSLGVGLATEHSIKHHSCTYLTAMKLYSYFFQPDTGPSGAIKDLWNWRSSSVLVIDDINAGDPIKDEIVNADQFIRFIDTYTTSNKENRQDLATKKIIWILGTPDAGPDAQASWHKMLQTIGVPEEKILTVVLS